MQSNSVCRSCSQASLIKCVRFLVYRAPISYQFFHALSGTKLQAPALAQLAIVSIKNSFFLKSKNTVIFLTGLFVSLKEISYLAGPHI